MAAWQGLGVIPWGFLAGGGASLTLALNNSGAGTQIWEAWSFIAEKAVQITKIKHYCTAITGTMTANTDLACELYSDTGAGIPNASIEQRVTTTTNPTNGTAPMWVEWTGFTATSTLVAGTQYWIVFKNLNAVASGATNFPTYMRPVAGYIPNNLNTSAAWNWGYAGTVNGGGAWATQVQQNVAGPRLEFTDGTFAGLPLQSAVVTAAANAVFGTQEVGYVWTPPANCSMNVIGITMPISNKTSTPGALRFRLYNGITPLGTTYSVPSAAVFGGPYTAFFSSPIAITSAMTSLRVVAGDATAGDANTTRYNLLVYTTENAAASLALKPLSGTMSRTVIPNNTDLVTFPPVDTATDWVAGAVLLDGNGLFNSTSSGGGQIFGDG